MPWHAVFLHLYIQWWDKSKQVYEDKFLPSCQPVNCCAVKLQMTNSLSCTGQRSHDDHQLWEACSITIGQHVGCHWNERAEENGANSFAHLAVVTYNMSGEQLQKLSIFLHYFQLFWVFWRSGCHARQPRLESRGLHAGQLSQGTTQTQKAGVWALLRWEQINTISLTVTFMYVQNDYKWL